MHETRANTTTPAPDTRLMGMTPRPRPCTNSTGASGTDVRPVIRNAPTCTRPCSIEPWTTKRSRRQETNGPTDSQVPSRGHVGMFLECSLRVQSGRVQLSSPSKPPSTPPTSRRVLRGSNQCHMSLRSSRGGRGRDSIQRLHLLVSLGQQVRRLPRWTSHLSVRTRHHRSLALFQASQMYRPTTAASLPSRAALP